ncbi:hypothetical protein ACQKMD_09875 [Viridibacillus sp. NPDC096237]|uniref:hypothetical protein n=1 Tax=Viridibacillus sp. NPDC096237 TaxID=3390721 RepID=UPI003D07CB9E
MRIIHTMPLIYHPSDLIMFEQCFESLGESDEKFVVIYNQGNLSKSTLEAKLAHYKIPNVILGNGENMGIAQARQKCFEYIWDNFKEVDYISEIHLDMVFPENWYESLTHFLDTTDEPMVSPGILTSCGELQPIGQFIVLPEYKEDMISVLKSFSQEEVRERFVHPVIHKAKALKAIGGYDLQFFKGKQGYEDDSLLLGYFYYMGTRTNWRPKCYLKSWVYHATMAQRMSVPDKHLDFQTNKEGLFLQYGAYGMKHLSHLHQNQAFFDNLLKEFIQ